MSANSKDESFDVRERIYARHLHDRQREEEIAGLRLQLGHREEELAAIRLELESLRQKIPRGDEALVGWVMRSWLNALGGRVFPKSHMIDSLAITTRNLVEEKERLHNENLTLRQTLKEFKT